MLTRVDPPAVVLEEEPVPTGPTLTGTAVLVGALVCVAAIVIGVIQMAAPAPEGFDQPTARATPSRASYDDADGARGAGPGAEPPWDPYADVDEGGRAAGDAARQRWEPVVEQFTDRFLDPGPSRTWIRALAPVVTDQLLERLRYVTSGEVPAGRLEALEVVASGDHAVDVTVEVTGETGSWLLGVRAVDLPHDGVGWRVYGYEHRGVGR